MEIIEFDRWKPSADDPRKLEYVGQRTAQEVFEELKHRLDGQGYLPDEYFLLRDEWKNGREIPQEADLFCTVDYGESEGVYVDVYLKWYAYMDHRHIAKEIIRQCTNEQIAAAPPYLLELFAQDADFHTLSALVEKGISSGDSAARTLHMLTYEGGNSWMAEELLEKRMWVDPNNYGALHACVENGAVDVAKLLLDGGMDFEQYRQRFPGSGSPDTIQALEEHWAKLQVHAQEQGEEQAPIGPEAGGLQLG